MGLFDLLQIKTQNEDAFEEELKELETQKKHIIEKIGEKFASENRYNDMSGTEYEELFARLSKIESEMDKILDQVAGQIKEAKSISLKRTVDAFIKELGDSLSPEKEGA